MTRLQRRSCRLVVFLAGLPFVAACASHQQPRTAVETAEAASAAQNWPRAAELWTEIHLAQGGRDKRAYLESARALFLAGDESSACGMLRQGLVVFPDDPDLLELSGRIQRDCGFRRAAEGCYSRVVELDPDRVCALRALAELRMELGLEHAAVAPLERIVELTGGDARTLELLGDVQRIGGEPVAALHSYERAIALGEVSQSTLVEAAGLCILPPVRAEAPEALARGIGWLETAVQRDPQSTRAHFLLGLLNEELGRAEHAARHYRRAVELDPGCIESLTNLAVLYSRMGDAGGTSEMVARALELEGDPGRRAALMELLGDGIR